MAIQFPEGAGAAGSEADIRKDRARFMTPRPARRERRAGMIARPVSQTRISRRSSMGQMHRDHARKQPRDERFRRAELAGVVGRAWRLTICSASWISTRLAIVVLQFAKHPQQPQFEQRLHRLRYLRSDGIRQLRLCRRGARPWNRSWETPSASATCIRRPASGRPDPLPAFARRLPALPQGRSAKARVRAILPSQADRCVLRSNLLIVAQLTLDCVILS